LILNTLFASAAIVNKSAACGHKVSDENDI